MSTILEKECWLLTETLAYFYAVVEDKADATKVVEEIEAERAQYPSVTRLEVVERKFFGKPVKASHVEVAKMLKEKGWRLTVGDRVDYVVVVGSGCLYERVKPYVFASYDEVDIEYYVCKQVVPAVARVLESFGITEEQLLKSGVKEKETRRHRFFWKLMFSVVFCCKSFQ